MRKIIILSLIVLLLLSACGHTIPLTQSMESITEIELVKDTEEYIVHTLTDEEALQFLNTLMNLEIHKSFQPREDIGYLQVHIHYENGDVDFIGCSGNGTIKSDEQIISGWYYFKESDLLELFDLFID